MVAFALYIGPWSHFCAPIALFTRVPTHCIGRQVYVALSRATCLEGLHIESFNNSLVRASPKVEGGDGADLLDGKWNACKCA